MLILVLTALVCIAITIIMHGLGTSWWLHRVGWRYPGAQQRLTVTGKAGVLIQTVLFLIMLHFVEILLWAGAYMLVAAEEFETFEAAIYFSAVTFTTLGYGDITLSSNWRLLSGFEAIGGIVLLGWTTAFLFAVLQRIWEAHMNMTGGTHERFDE
jgi:voltage-gated potassium channel